MPDERDDARASYHIGDVGAHARVQQGKYLTMIEHSFAGIPGGEDLTKRFTTLLDRISTKADMDADVRELAMEKTQQVAESLATAAESPGKLRRALIDAKGWCTTAASWVWDELSTILKSEAAQKTISTVSEATVKAAVGALLGGK